MRSVIAFFTEKKEPTHLTVAKEAYSNALETLESTKNLSIAEIKERYLSELLAETLQKSVNFFRKNPKYVGYEGDKKCLDDLESQLKEKVFVPDMLQTLEVNVYNIKLGIFDRSLVDTTFSTILGSPRFQGHNLWASEVKHSKEETTRADKLSEKVEVVLHQLNQLQESDDDDFVSTLQGIEQASPEAKKQEKSIQRTKPSEEKSKKDEKKEEEDPTETSIASLSQ